MTGKFGRNFEGHGWRNSRKCLNVSTQGDRAVEGFEPTPRRPEIVARLLPRALRRPGGNLRGRRAGRSPKLKGPEQRPAKAHGRLPAAEEPEGPGVHPFPTVHPSGLIDTQRKILLQRSRPTHSGRSIPPALPAPGPKGRTSCSRQQGYKRRGPPPARPTAERKPPPAPLPEDAARFLARCAAAGLGEPLAVTEAKGPTVADLGSCLSGGCAMPWSFARSEMHW